MEFLRWVLETFCGLVWVSVLNDRVSPFRCKNRCTFVKSCECTMWRVSMVSSVRFVKNCGREVFWYTRYEVSANSAG